MTRWSARFRAYTPVDTVDTVDTVQPLPVEARHSVNSVHSVKAPISEETRAAPPPPVSHHETDAEIETLAEALMAEAERNPAVRITDPEKARLYFEAEARRRLDLIARNAALAVSGEDEERAALMAEEAAPTLPAEAHNAAVAALLLAASPLAGTPGARPCRSCGRGIWTSPTWAGPAPRDLCAECWRETAL